jgi:hypothetical protein
MRKTYPQIKDVDGSVKNTLAYRTASLITASNGFVVKAPPPPSGVGGKDKTFSNVAGSSSLGVVVVVLAADGVDVVGLLLLQVRLL